MTTHVYDRQLGEIALIVDHYHVIPGQEGSFHQEHIEPEMEVVDMRVVLEDGSTHDDWEPIYERHIEAVHEAIWENILAY